MKDRKNPQTHDYRTSIEGLESRRCLALRLAVKNMNINEMIRFMTGHVAPQHLDHYFNLALQDTNKDEQL